MEATENLQDATHSIGLSTEQHKRPELAMALLPRLVTTVIPPKQPGHHLHNPGRAECWGLSLIPAQEPTKSTWKGCWSVYSVQGMFAYTSKIVYNMHKICILFFATATWKVGNFTGIIINWLFGQPSPVSQCLEGFYYMRQVYLQNQLPMQWKNGIKTHVLYLGPDLLKIQEWRR